MFWESAYRGKLIHWKLISCINKEREIKDTFISPSKNAHSVFSHGKLSNSCLKSTVWFAKKHRLGVWLLLKTKFHIRLWEILCCFHFLSFFSLSSTLYSSNTAWPVSFAVFFTIDLIPIWSMLNAVTPTLIAELIALSVALPASSPYLLRKTTDL